MGMLDRGDSNHASMPHVDASREAALWHELNHAVQCNSDVPYFDSVSENYAVQSKGGLRAAWRDYTDAMKQHAAEFKFGMEDNEGLVRAQRVPDWQARYHMYSTGLDEMLPFSGQENAYNNLVPGGKQGITPLSADTAALHADNSGGSPEMGNRLRDAFKYGPTRGAEGTKGFSNGATVRDRVNWLRSLSSP